MTITDQFEWLLNKSFTFKINQVKYAIAIDENRYK